MNLNLERESHKVHNKKIDEQIDSFVTWIKVVNVPDANMQEAIDYLYFLSCSNHTTPSYLANLCSCLISNLKIFCNKKLLVP